MSIINSQPLIGASGNQSTAYNLTRSLRFRSSASAYLNRTPASAGNRRTATFSFWIKRGTLSADHAVYSLGAYPTNLFEILFLSDNTLYIQNTPNSTTRDFFFQTTQVFRDPSAWYHIVLQIDTTQATSSNRAKLYINGSQVTAFSTATYPNQNTDLNLGLSTANQIGRRADGNYYQDAYLAEFHHIDGQSLDASSFGETDTATGVWKPKKYTGTYGTNGFYLKFDNLTSTSTLGNDSSGNSNTWTVNNISLTSGSTYDSMKDVPTLTDADTANYAVWNPLTTGGFSISNGNLGASVTASTGDRNCPTTIFASSGKWYAEVIATNVGAGGNMEVGIVTQTSPYTPSIGGSGVNGYAYQPNGTKGNNNTYTSYGATYTNGDVIGIALDLDGGTLTFYKNNTSQGTAYTGITGAYGFAIGATFGGVSRTVQGELNCGQQPFAYTPPSGFKALNTFNLPTPTIGATASTQANKYFDATLYTGTGNNVTRSITNAAGFKPDLVWIKNRSDAYSHLLANSIVGGGSQTGLASDQTFGESGFNDNSTYGYLSTFDSNGFTVTAGSSSVYTNQNGSAFVAWQWQAGQGTTSSNTAGSITSTVSANTTAGFSIVTFTSASSGNFTVGHGLGVKPAFIILKTRDTAGYNWHCWHQSLSSNTNSVLLLNTTAAESTSFAMWGASGANTTTIGITSGNPVPTSSACIAYCFAEVAGYSKFGSYTGNGSTDGAFVFTGFRPKYLIIKGSTTAQSWEIRDSAREPYNDAYRSVVFADLSDAEYVDLYPIDFLSNGFKIRNNGTGTNSNGNTYIYAAFAESPFKYSLAR